MGTSLAELPDASSTLERELVGSLGLERAAKELGAVTVAVLLTEGPRVELIHFWSRSGAVHKPRVSRAQQNLAKALEGWSGPIDGRDSLAELLRDWITHDAQSFLAFPSRIQRQLVTILFGFPEPVVPHHGVPEVVAEKLQLIGIATWSVREVTRLRANLEVVNNRLSRRKLVERAKGVLQSERGISEEEAYAHLRRTSRQRRIPITELAEEVLRGRSSLAPSGRQR